MTVAARACLAAGLGALPVLALAPSAHADDFFQAQTTAAAVHVVVTQKPAGSIITASLIDDAIGYAAGDFDSGSSSDALAAAVFPGRLVVQGPQLLCSQLFSCPTQPPDYPLLADASFPRRQQDTADVSGDPMGSGPVVATPLRSHATATQDGNSGETAAAKMSLLSGTPGAVTVGGSSAVSTVTTTGSGMQVHVESVVSDVSVAGILHIDTIRAVDDLAVTSAGHPTSHPHVTLAGVTVAGHAATIDDSGVHVDGTEGPAAAQELSQHGVTVRTLGAHASHTRNGTRSDAAGLSVSVQLPVEGLPYIPNPLPPFPPPFDQIPALPGVNANGTYVADITFGAVGAAAGVGTEPSFDVGGVGTIPSGHHPSRPGSAAARVPSGGQATGTAITTPPDQSAPSVAQPPQSLMGGFRDILSKDKLEILYAVLALGTLALFIGWRGSMLLTQRRLAAGRRRR